MTGNPIPTFPLKRGGYIIMFPLLYYTVIANNRIREAYISSKRLPTGCKGVAASHKDRYGQCLLLKSKNSSHVSSDDVIF